MLLCFLTFVMAAAMSAAIPRRRGAFCDGGPSLVDDFMWVSVLRMAPGGQGVGHCDGHCHGLTAREASSSTYDAIIPNSSRWSKVNYGCWFYMAINASAHSGAYVNVGRSLRLRTRCEAHEVLYKSRKSSNALCTDRPGDKLWCTQARAQGYDSIQIQRGTAYYPNSRKRRPWGELIYCGDECAHQTFSESACVPVAVAKNNTPCACPQGASQLSCTGERLQGWPSATPRTSGPQPAGCQVAPSFVRNVTAASQQNKSSRTPNLTVLGALPNRTLSRCAPAHIVSAQRSTNISSIVPRLPVLGTPGEFHHTFSNVASLESKLLGAAASPSPPMSAFALISSCHSDKWASSNVSAARQPVCVAAEHLAMVRCCTDRECTSVCPLPKDKANAYGVRLPVAEALCLARGARLCTVAELAHKCCQKGCGYDYAFTWSSDRCSAPAAARVDPFLLQPSFAGGSSCQAGAEGDGGGVPLLFIPQCNIDGVFSSLRPLLPQLAVLRELRARQLRFSIVAPTLRYSYQPSGYVQGGHEAALSAMYDLEHLREWVGATCVVPEALSVRTNTRYLDR